MVAHEKYDDTLLDRYMYWLDEEELHSGFEGMLTFKRDFEAFITDESKVITLAAKEYPILKIFVSVESDNISIILDGKYYDANKSAQAFLYEIHLPEYTKKGIYSFDILNGSDTVATGQKFEVKKKGFSEVSLFD